MKLLFCGDISFSSIDRFEFSPEVKELFSNQDLVIGNLESVITGSQEKIDHHPVHLRTDLHHVDHLAEFDVLCMANNHALDYSREGLNDTVEILASRGISSFGAGNDSTEANRPFILEKGGQKLAFLAFTRFANASANRAGAANDNVSRILRDIRRLKRENCFVIVMPHWGYEHVPVPAPRQRWLARRMIRNGADIVVGTHPHIHQGYEHVGHKIAFYSLGNFIFSSKNYERYQNWKLQESVMIEIDISPDKLYSYRFIPYHSNHERILLLHGAEKAFVLDDVEMVRGVIEGNFRRYLKQYFHYVGFINEFGRRALKKQLSQPQRKTGLLKKVKKLVRVYSKADWQDVVNRFYKLFMVFLVDIEIRDLNKPKP